MGKNRKIKNRSPRRNQRRHEPTGKIGPKNGLPSGTKRATDAQVMAAKLININNNRAQELRNLASEQEKNAKLTAVLAETQRKLADSTAKLVQLETANINRSNDELFAAHSLKEGCRLTDQLEGHEGVWMIVESGVASPKATKKPTSPEQLEDDSEDDEFLDAISDDDDDFEDEDEFEDEEEEEELPVQRT